MLWDTAGQEEFDAITKAYYRGKECRNSLTEKDTDIILFVFNLCFFYSEYLSHKS